MSQFTGTPATVVATPSPTLTSAAQATQQKAKQTAQVKYDQAQTLRQQRIAKEQAAIQANYQAQQTGQSSQSKTFLQKIFGNNGLFGWKG